MPVPSANLPYSRAGLRASWASWSTRGLRAPVGPAWLQWLWTLLFCLAIAVPFTVLGFALNAGRTGSWGTPGDWAYWYGRNLVVSGCIGFLIHALFALTRRLLDPEAVERWPMWRRTVLFSGVSLLGVAIGWPLGLLFNGINISNWFASGAGQNLLIGSSILALVLTLLLHQYFHGKAQRLEAEARATEAQLRLLQAQIEPHFLFNTLANVTALIDPDPVLAKAMLERFTAYLRASLGSLRKDFSTLEAEADLVTHYLALLQARMEDRLRYQVDIDPTLRAAELPPLLLQPLVENAVHHGLEPKLDGGTVRILARREGAELVLSVIDDGLGTAAARRPRKGNGIALDNLRERLRARYEGAAHLHLDLRDDGATATLRLPLYQSR